MTEVKESLKTQMVTSPVTTVADPIILTQPLSFGQTTNLTGKLRVGLLMGGASSEKEISLESARHVYNSLDREKYFVIPVFVDENRRLWLIEEWQLWKNTTTDLTESLKGGGQRIYYEEIKEHADFVFSALHGKWGEEALPGLLEILRIPNNCASVLGGALSMDKYRQRLILKAEGIAVPKYLAVQNSDFRVQSERIINQIEKELDYPFMVKPSREGSSTALAKVKSRAEVGAAFATAFEFDNLILAEEVLEGMELTTTIYGLNDEVKALPPSQMYKGGDFLTAEEKFLPGGAQMVTPPPLPEELIMKIQAESVKAFRSLGLKVYSRIDSFLIGPNLSKRENSYRNVSRETFLNEFTKIGDYKVVILEPNNPPAMTPSTALWLQAAEAGMNASQFLDEIIKISLKAHRQKIGPL